MLQHISKLIKCMCGLADLVNDWLKFKNESTAIMRLRYNRNNSRGYMTLTIHTCNAIHTCNCQPGLLLHTHIYLCAKNMSDSGKPLARYMNVICVKVSLCHYRQPFLVVTFSYLTVCIQHIFVFNMRETFADPRRKCVLIKILQHFEAAMLGLRNWTIRHIIQHMPPNNILRRRTKFRRDVMIIYPILLSSKLCEVLRSLFLVAPPSNV